MKIRKDKVVMIVSLWVLLTAIIALLGIFSKNSIVVFSVNDKNNIVYDFYASKNNDASGDLDYVYVDFQDERIPNNKSFIVPFKVKSQYGIRNFDYTQVGFLILSSRIINSEQINIELMCSSSADEHSLSLDIKLESDTVLNVQLYAVANETGVYISQFTKDDAYEKYLSFAVSNGLLSESESVRMRMDFCKYSVTEVNYTSNNTSVADLPTSITNEATLLQNQDTYANVTQTDSSANTYIKGKLEWIADDGVIHPLRRVQVKICDYESNVLTQNLGTVFTDNDGNYSFAFENKDKLLDFENGGYDLFIKVYAGDSNVMVVKPNGEDYYYQSDEKANMNVATGSTTTINMKINMSSNLGRAFQISQALITARDFAWNMKGSMPSDATAKYPVDSSGCYYQRENSQISITNRIYDNVPLNSYASWDVIMHEYGHHIEYEMGIIESCGGWHTFPTNMADHYAGANTCGLRAPDTEIALR